MKKFAAITMMLVAISCRSAQKEVAEASPSLAAQHAAGVASLRTSPTMADLVTLESDLRELREVMRVDSGGADDLKRIEIMRGEAVLAAQGREDELRAARLGELDECMRRIAKLQTMVSKGADVDRIVQSLRECVDCATDHQTEDFLLKTEADADRVRRAASAAILSVCPTAG